MPVKFFLQYSSLAPPACSLVLYLVLVVKPETYRTQNKIHKLQHDVLGGVHLAYLILVYVYVCLFERLIKIKPKNIVLEFLLVGTFQWYVSSIRCINTGSCVWLEYCNPKACLINW